MRYRLTILTPTIAGDGQRLAPIDYMVWKDHVNVLDQNKIFRLLAKGPRLDGYLMQIKKAERLDFTQWGGYAQNYALRRVAFESPACTPAWNEARIEDLFMPTFARNAQGSYLPGSVIKGAVRALVVQMRTTAAMVADVAEKMPRRPGLAVEERAVGGGRATDRLRVLSFSDSSNLPADRFKIYQLRVASPVRRGNDVVFTWKQGSKFAEMAAPGATFEGTFDPNTFLTQSEIAAGFRWGSESVESLMETANQGSIRLLEAQANYLRRLNLTKVVEETRRALDRAQSLAGTGRGCVLQLGWATGMPAKSATADPGAGAHRAILENTGFYGSALKSGLPFPKSRKIVFANGQAASLPGMVLLEIQ